MPIHKLSDGPITMTIASADMTEGKFGPQFRLTGEDGTAVFVSESSGKRQLDRLSLTPESVVGKTLYIEQVEKNGTKYTNMSLAGAGSVTRSAPAAAPAAAAPRQTVEELGAIYQQCVDQAMITIGNRLMDSGTPFDGAVIQAAAATLFIKATR